MTLHKQALGAGNVAVVPVTGTALGTGVEEQYGSGLRQGPGQVGGQRGFADPSFLVDDCDHYHYVAPARLNQHHLNYMSI